MMVTHMCFCLVVLLIFIPQGISPLAGACELIGYDLETLHEADFWVTSLANTADCLVPENAIREGVSHCEVRISVCKRLGQHCPGFENSTACQRVILHNGTEYFFDMGEYQGNAEFNPLNGEGNGFTAVRTAGEPPESPECSAAISTALTFVCDVKARWDRSTPNVTVYRQLAGRIGTSCIYTIQLKYDGACYTAPTLSPSHCSLDPYNTERLSSRDTWEASVPTRACFAFYDGGDINACIISLSFCHPVPPSRGDICYQSSVCQISANSSDDKITEYNMGSFSNNTRFYVNDEKEGFHMSVANGSKPKNGSLCAKGLSTEVILTCNKSAQWNTQDISEFIQVAYQHQDDPCKYVLMIDYDGACRSGPPSPPEPTSPPEPSLLCWTFIGLSIFLALCLVLLITALIVCYVLKKKKVSVNKLLFVPSNDPDDA